MLHWRPEDRSDIQDNFTDEWLCADLIRPEKVVCCAEGVVNVDKDAEKEASPCTEGPPTGHY
jgi:hypothetical protein